VNTQSVASEAASDGYIQRKKKRSGWWILKFDLAFHHGLSLAFLAESSGTWNSTPFSNLQQWHHLFGGQKPWTNVGFFGEAGFVGLEALDICSVNLNGQATQHVFFVKVLPLHVLLKPFSVIWTEEVHKAQALVCVSLGVPWQVEKVEDTLESMLLHLVHKHVLAVVKRNLHHDNRHHGLNWFASRVSCVWTCHLSRLDFSMLRLLHLLQHLNSLRHLCG